MRKILIAVDGSPPSTEALEFGLDLAAEEEARAIVVHVAPAIDVLHGGGFGLSPGAVVHELAPADKAPLVQALELAKRKRVPISVELLRGPTVPQIVGYADEQDVDLIVLGSRGHNALASVLLGSVSLGVLRHTTKPVLVVRGLAEAPVEQTVEQAEHAALV